MANQLPAEEIERRQKAAIAIRTTWPLQFEFLRQTQNEIKRLERAIRSPETGQPSEILAFVGQQMKNQAALEETTKIYDEALRTFGRSLFGWAAGYSMTNKDFEEEWANLGNRHSAANDAEADTKKEDQPE